MNIDPCPISHVYFGEISYLPGSQLGPRTQRDLQIVSVYKGSIRLRASDKEVTIASREAILLQPYTQEMFNFDPVEPTHHGWATWTFRRDRANHTSPQALASHFLRPMPMDQRYLDLFQIGLDLYRGDGTPAQLDAIYRTLLEEHLAERQRVALPEALEKAQSFMNDHLAQSIDAKAIARAAHCSLPHLNRLFRLHLKQSPMDRLWSLRETRAAECLQNTGLSVEAIAEACGFRTASHFCQRFRVAMGRTPLQYRKAHWAAARP